MKRNKNANNFRKALTKEELKFWHSVSNRKFYNLKFRRQHPLDKYILDFVCLDKKLIVELDGVQHAFEENKVKDGIRDKFFEEMGYKILRFWNNEVNENIESVLNTIAREAGIFDSPSPS